MTIPSSINRSGPYTCNGVTTAFDFEFKIVDETHVQVIHAVDGAETTLQLTSDYIVQDVGQEDGGRVVISPAPTVGTITLLLNVPFTQDTDLENQGAYSSETVERALDLGLQRTLQLKELVDRSVKLPASADIAELDSFIQLIHYLGGFAPALAALSSIKTEIQTVAAIEEEVTGVYAIRLDLSAVRSMADSVSTVVGIAPAVSTVAGIAAQVQIVADLAPAVAASVPVQDQINAATDEAFADDAMLVARKANGSLLKRSWANIKTALGSLFSDVNEYAMFNEGLWADGIDSSDYLAVYGNTPQLWVNKSASGQENWIIGACSNKVRWGINVGNSLAETGANAGSNFQISRYTDAGAYIDNPLVIRRDNGLISLNGGVSLNSGQMKFPTAKAPSTDANTLDDYEEKAFTPTIIGTTAGGAGTYTTQTGAYTKIGNRVFFDIELTWTAHTGTGNMKVSGLPFASLASRKAVVSLSYSNLTFAAAPHGYVEPSASTIVLLTSATGAAEAALPMDTAATLRITGHYATT